MASSRTGNLLLLCILAAFCEHCIGCGPITPCIDTSVVTHASGSIKKYVNGSIAATLLTSHGGIFSSNSSFIRWRVMRSTECRTKKMFFVISTMSEGDYMQADRIRYAGHMCSVRNFTSKRSVLFGMSKSENTTSNFRVGYICPTQNSDGMAHEMYKCPLLWNYAMSDDETFKRLVEFLRINTQKESVEVLKNPGSSHLCRIFKLAKTTCNLETFNIAVTDSC